jgi:CheY-like chemotaxis protein
MRSPPSGSGTRPRVAHVLIVDDERLLASVIGRVLARHYEVEVVNSSTEALARLLAGDTFDLILCDVMMPSMTGVELWERLRQARPQVADRVVFMSGGGFTDHVSAFFATTSRPLLEKPLDFEVVRRLIDERVAVDVTRAHESRTS